MPVCISCFFDALLFDCLNELESASCASGHTYTNKHSLAWQTATCRHTHTHTLPAHSGLSVWRLAISHHSAEMSGTQTKIAPNHTDGEADRPTDMDVDVYNNTSFMMWVMLMLWQSASTPGRKCGNRDRDACNLCEHVRAGGRSWIAAYWKWDSASAKKKDEKRKSVLYFRGSWASAPATL